MKKRDMIDDKFKWDLSSLYKSDDEFEVDFKFLEDNYLEYKKFEGKLNNSSDIYDFFIFDEKFSTIFEKVISYSSLKFDEDVTNFKYQEMSGRVDNLYAKIGEVTSFIVPEMMKLNNDDIDRFIDENEKLELYRFELEELLRGKPHILSLEEERLLTLLSNPLGSFEEISSYLCNSDIKFGKILDKDGDEKELTNTNFSIYISSLDRSVRKRAFDALYKQYENMQNTFAKIYSSHVRFMNTNAKIRGYKSARDAALFGGNIDPNIYDNLIDTVHKNLFVMDDYYKLKKDVLGLDELHVYDIYTPLIGESTKKYSFDEAKGYVLDALSVLGEEYVRDLKQAFDDRWIDVYPNEGKKGGAYSGGCYLSNPYVLLNFNGKFNDVSTLAHELGHSMHSYYSKANNPFIYYEYKIFVAEVASQVNEIILSRYLIDHTDDRLEKLNILDNLMELFKGSIVRQTMFAEFEKYMHEADNSTILTSKFISDKYFELYKLYSGSEMTCDDLIRYEWEKIPHFYYNFYVYQYATGLAAACYIASNILEGKEGALESYLRFLKLGGSKHPVDELKEAMVDMNNPEVIQKCMDMFRDTIREFKELY